MTGAVATSAPPTRAERKPPGGPRHHRRLIAYWLGGIVVALTALVLLASVVIDTAPGRRLLVQIVDKTTMENGLGVRVGRIDGSIYGRMTLNDIALRDTKGVFLTSPTLTLDWGPGELLHRHVLLNEVASPLVRLLRAPLLKPALPKPNQPIIPDIYLTVKRLAIGELVLEPAVTGDRRSLAIEGAVELLHQRAKVRASATAQSIDGHAGGDRLNMELDAEPTANRLMIDAHLAAPRGGIADRLAKLGAPLTFDLSGSGTWSAWNGRAVSMLDDQSLFDAAIEARGGVFHVEGDAQPALVVKADPVKALTNPALAFDVTAKMQDRQLDLDARVGSSALDVAAKGRLDLAHSRFVGVKVDARLLKPPAASPKLTGRDVRASLTLNGAMAQPAVDYDIAAAQIGFDQTLIEALHVAGKAQVDANQTLRLPLHATATRVLGLPQAAGGLTTNLKVDGDLMISARQIASDNLRIRSDRLDATLVMALSLNTGRYNAALEGRINRYAVAGLGVVDLVTDAHLIPTGKGAFRIGGHVHVMSERIDNPSVMAQLGGRAVIDADFSRTPDGAFGVANLRLASPKFHITDGHGRYGTDGRIDFVANAVSATYGPLKLTISGTAGSPQARLQAPDPQVGGVTGLDVSVKGSGPDAYLVTAAAQSPYGAISADLHVRLGKSGLEADIHHASVAGISVSGTVRQTPSGPFAGGLRLVGSGLSGTASLSGVGKVQRVDVALRASNARLPLTPPVTIARGNATITAVLYPDAPAITGRATLAGVRREQLMVANATADVKYQGGKGRVSISADGNNSVPFSIAADAGISPDLIQVNGQGSVNRIAIRLAAPADIRKTKGGYALSATTVLLPQGRLSVAGATGASGVTASLRAEAVDLSIAQAFAPTLGVAGKLSGDADVSLPNGGGMPTGKVNMQLSGFTRAGLTTVSEPVDVALLATLAQNGAEAHALVRRRGAIIGRLQGKLTPSGARSQPWLDRLKAAPLTGGVRYDGPSEALWGLSGIAGQSLSGPIAIGVDVSGQLERPQVRGVIRAQALRYSNDTLGTAIDHIVIDGDFTDTRFELQKLTGQAGKGSLSASGYADLSSAKGFPIALNAKMNNAVLARSDDVGATVSGDLAINNDRAKGALVSGKLTLNDAAYQVVKQGAGQVVELAGVRRKGQPRGAPITPSDAKAAASGPPSVWKLDIAVDAPAHILVRGMGLDAEWGASLRITGDATHPVIVGDVQLVRGTFSFAGRELTVSKGVIHLDGSIPPDPTLDIEASATVDATTATIDIGGTASNPQITFSSVPALAQDEVLSRLLFGASVAQISPLQAIQLAAALNSLRGSSGGGFNPLGKLRSAAGLDRLNFYGANTATGQGPSVGAGKYISRNIYVEVTTDTKGYTATQIEIALTRSLKLLSAVGALGTSNVGLKYSHDY